MPMEGSYYSDQPKDPSLWKIGRFCQEIEEVRKALELENFYLYGFSALGICRASVKVGIIGMIIALL